MKMMKIVLSLLLALSLFGCSSEKENVAVTQSYLAETLGIEVEDGEAAVSNQDAIKVLLEWTGLSEEALGDYPNDYNAFAESLGLIDEETDLEAQIMSHDFDDMMKVVSQVRDAANSEKLEPLFINGMAQPIFPYTKGTVEGYTNENSDVLRFSVYVETDYDTDGDGKLDLVKAVVQLPKSAAEGNYKAATIYEARPYISGCSDGTPINDLPGEGVGFDMESLHAQPEARTPEGEATTLEAAAQASQDEWFYFSPYEGITDYEDLDWYDYFLARGFAVVLSAGIGTNGSEGFETCGSDVEIDAFAAIIEWLSGDRVAYTDKENNIEIKADWSNGNVGMTGRSYAGTTQFGLAATGVKGLKTIVPVAGIASWYDYYNCQGTNIGGEEQIAGLAMYCAGRYIDREDWASIEESYGAYLHQLADDMFANGNDYNELAWSNRDYTLSDDFNCSALIVHGLNDFNVRTKQSEMMFNSFKEAGLDVKLLLHQGDHITPTHQDTHAPIEDENGELVITDDMWIAQVGWMEPGTYTIYDDVAGFSVPVAGHSYDDILNAWYCHYLYGIDNGIEDELPEALVQSNLDENVWDSYDSYISENKAEISVSAEDAEVEISADYAAAGLDLEDEEAMGHDEFVVKVPSTSNVIFTTELESDLIVKGTIEVDFSAALAHATEGANNNLIINALVVDLDEEPFTLFDKPGYHVDTYTVEGGEGAHWMGSGVTKMDIKNFQPMQRDYKVIAEGWVDLANPASGYASATSTESIVPVVGEYHDYTMFLQPNVYTVPAGHKLALVITAYDPDTYTPADTDYSFTINTETVKAILPVATDNISLEAAQVK